MKPNTGTADEEEAEALTVQLRVVHFYTHMKIKKTLQRSEGFTLRSFVFKLYFCEIILHKYSPFIQLQLSSFLYYHILMSR